MHLGSIFIGLAFLILSILWVIDPIVNEKRRKLDSENVEPVSMGARHAEALLALRDIEFDYRTGKITDEDYGSLRSSLLAQAAAAIEAQEKQKVETGDRLEIAIRARREKQTTRRVCSHCGAKIGPTDHFCRTYGISIDNTCPKCGRNIKATDYFCAGCGAPVSAMEPTQLETVKPGTQAKSLL